MAEPRKHDLERGHLRWLAGVLGLFALSEPLGPDQLAERLPGLEFLSYPEGETIIREGDSGKDLYVLYSGAAAVDRGGEHIADLQPGSLLGEVGLLMGSARTATVKAGPACKLFRIPEIQRFLGEFPMLKDFLQDTALRRIDELKHLADMSSSPSSTTETPTTEALTTESATTERLPEAAAPAVAGMPAKGHRLGGKYELRSLIGKGGMGEVYSGYDHALERRIALKSIHPDIQGDARARKDFIQEAKIIAQLNHPFILSIHDILEEGGIVFLVLEYVEGRTLDRLVRERKRLTIKECRMIMTCVCQAVSYAHWNKVFHRDLKTSNIMLDRSGYVKVMDFGLARKIQESLARLTQKDASGTPAYMPPEQHMGEFVPASDVYSLGVCLYEMLTGAYPFQGGDLLTKKRGMRYKSPRSLVPGLPASIDGFFKSALSPDPERRIPTALEFLERLKRL